MTKNGYDFVIDCSVTMAWCFEDESTEFTDSILDSLEHSTAIVPSLWSLEVANVLLLSMKNKRITDVQLTSFIDDLSLLPITVDQSTSSRAMKSTLTLARKANLTICDACYLELAIREQLPLLTLDRALIKAAKNCGIPTKHLIHA